MGRHGLTIEELETASCDALEQITRPGEVQLENNPRPSRTCGCLSIVSARSGRTSRRRHIRTSMVVCPPGSDQPEGHLQACDGGELVRG
jgi:hypothetical protein